MEKAEAVSASSECQKQSVQDYCRRQQSGVIDFLARTRLLAATYFHVNRVYPGSTSDGAITKSSFFKVYVYRGIKWCVSSLSM